MFKYSTSLIVIFMVVSFGDSKKKSLDDPTYFPPYKCETRNSKEKGTSTTETLWPNGQVIYDIGTEYSGKIIFIC